MSCWARQDSLVGSIASRRMPSSSKRKKSGKGLQRFGRRVGRLFGSSRGQNHDDAAGSVPIAEGGTALLAGNGNHASDARELSLSLRGRPASVSSSIAPGFVRRALRAISGSRSASRTGGERPLVALTQLQPLRDHDSMSAVQENATEAVMPMIVTNGSAVEVEHLRPVSNRIASDNRSLSSAVIGNGGHTRNLHGHALQNNHYYDPFALSTTFEDNNDRTSSPAPSRIIDQHTRGPAGALQSDLKNDVLAASSAMANVTVPFLDAARSQPMSKHHRNRLRTVLVEPSDAGDAKGSDSFAEQPNDFAALFLQQAFIQHLRAQEVLSESFCTFLSKLSVVRHTKKNADAASAITANVPGGDKALLERLVVALEKRSESAYYCFLYCLMLANRSDLARYVDAEAVKLLCKTIQSQPQLCVNLPEPLLRRLVRLATGDGEKDEMGSESLALSSGGGGDGDFRTRPKLNAQTSVSESFIRMQLQDDKDKSRNSSLQIESSAEVGESSPQSMTLPPDYFNLMTKPDFNRTYLGPLHLESENVYRMQSRPRGGALIINIVDYAHEQFQSRTGSEVDGENLDNLMKFLGFEVFEGHSHINQDAKQIKSLVERFCGWKRMHARADACFVAVLTHGERNNKLLTYDNMSIDTSMFEEALAKVPELAGKPKIFLFVACRGEEYDNGVPAYAPSTVPPPVLNGSMPPPLAAVAEQQRRSRQLVRPQRIPMLDIQAATDVSASHALEKTAESSSIQLNSSQIDGLSAVGSGTMPAFSELAPMSASSLTRNQGSMAQFWTYVRPGAVEHHQQLVESDHIDGTADASANSAVIVPKPMIGYEQIDFDAVADALGDPTRGACKQLTAGEITSNDESEAEEVASTEHLVEVTTVMSSSHAVGLNSTANTLGTLSASPSVSVAASAERLNVSQPVAVGSALLPPQSVPAIRRVANFMRQTSTASTTNVSISSTVVAHMIAQPNRDSSIAELRSINSVNVAPVEPQLSTPQLPIPMRIPLFADQCTIYSSYPNHRSLRNTTHGTWFINMLVKVFLTYSHIDDLSTLISKVNQCVSVISTIHGEKSIPQFHSTFTKRLYFNPHYPPLSNSSTGGHQGYAGGDAATTMQFRTNNHPFASTSAATAARSSCVEQLRMGGMQSGKR